MQLLEPKHFIMPFLAYAFSTLADNFIVARIAAKFKMTSVLASIYFLADGITGFSHIPLASLFYEVRLSIGL